MRLSEGGVSLWYGTPDAPAPSGTVASGSDISITIGLEPPDAHASVTILYRINHGEPHTVAAHATHHASGKQYYQAHLTGIKGGDHVEYVAVYHSGGRQVPSNQSAESHVVSFTVGSAGSNAGHAAHAEAKTEESAELKEALRTVLHASSVLSSPAQQDEFINLYFAHEGDTASFWTEVGKHADLKPHLPQLQLILQIDLLTAGHVPLIEAIVKLPGVHSMRDLALVDDSVWHKLVETSGAPHQAHAVAPHAPEQHYVDAVIATLEAAFPTLTVYKIVKKFSGATESRLDDASVGRLPERKRTAASPHSGAESHHVEPLAAKFLENATDFDIAKDRVDAYVDKHGHTAYSGIPEAQRPAVVKEVKRLQRLFAVSTNSSTFAGLLEIGLDSAHAIAVIPLGSFVSQHADKLGGEAQAAAVHERAQFINARNLNLRTSIHDTLRTPPTRALGHHSDAEMERVYGGPKSNSRPTGKNEKSPAAGKGGSLHDDLVKRFPNSDELFGSIALCNCEECESAIGPSAYLVDVLDFLGHSKPNEHGVTPLDVLIGDHKKKIAGRRPDLAHVPLTCSNTNTAMPYVDIINEILESYTALGLMLDAKSAHDCGDATSAELNANPQYVNDHAYEILDTAVYPFTLPFSRPLAVTRAYLGELGVSRRQVLDTFQKHRSSLSVRNALAAETFSMSAEEYQILTGHHFDTNEKTQALPVADYYGYHGGAAAGSWTHELSDVETYLQRTGLCWTDLASLARTRFINPSYPIGADGHLFARIPISYSSLRELLHNNLSGPVDALEKVLAAGISTHELDAWRKNNLDKTAKVLVIDAAGDSCDTSTMALEYFDGSAIDDHILDRMHRFIRLYRRSGWNIVDLDRAVYAFGVTDITPELIESLAHVKRLQGDLHVSNLQILLALWAPMETCGKDSLYRGLFLNKAAYREGVDVAFEQPFADSPVLTNSTTLLLPHAPVLQGAFRVSANDMALILADCGLDASAILSLANVTAIYRRAALAKALKLKVRDFLSFKAVAGCDPFASPMETERFASMARALGRSGLSIQNLDYIVRHTLPEHGSVEPSPAALQNLVRKLRDGLTGIAQGNVMAPDPTGAVTSQKLALLYDSGVVDQITQIINGTAVFTAPLIALPAGVAFPPQLTQKIAFDPLGQVLTCKAPLTAADRSALTALSADAAYLGALESIYQQALDPIKMALSPFLDPDEAQAKLVTASASVGPDLSPVQLDASGNVTTDPTKAQSTVIAVKYAYVLQGLLPYLIQQLGRALAKSAIADSLKLPDAIAQTLLETVVTARSGARNPALSDIHALVTPGLSAAYYAAADLSGTSTIGLDETVSFAGGKKVLPAGTAGARWTGMVAPPSSGDFIFIIRTNGTPTLWVDDLTTPLTLSQSTQTGEWTGQKVTLKTGQLYNIRLDIAQLPATSPTATLMWESASVRKAVIPGAGMYPSSVLQAFHDTYITLQKAALIVNALKLTTDELLFLTQPAGELPALNLNGVPVVSSGAAGTSIAALPHSGAEPAMTVPAAGSPPTAGSSPQLAAGAVQPPTVAAAASAPAGGSSASVSPGGQPEAAPVPAAAQPPASAPDASSTTGAHGSVAASGSPAHNAPSTEGQAAQPAATTSNTTPQTALHIAPAPQAPAAAPHLATASPATAPIAPTHALLPVNPAALLFAGIVRAIRYAEFRQDLPAADIALTAVFASSDIAGALLTLATVTGWDALALGALVGADGFHLQLADLQHETWLYRLKECFGIMAKLGASPETLRRWSTLSSQFKVLDGIAHEVKSCVQAQYDLDTWLTVAKKLNDGLRDAQRNALVAYLLPRMGLRDTDQLFEYFLLDPEMGVCTETSRISLAHSSVQTFVQRILINLEESDGLESISPHQIDADEWESWRKHYRYWEANYEILLYPENWLDQGLRDDKTPFFEELEGELMQQEITAENVETAYLNYLEKLQQVARLEVIGTFWQDKDPDTGEQVDTLHVFARTFHSPHTYFYRTFVNYMTWTPWQEMQVSIEGDHVLPMIWNRRLYVFWPTFQKKAAPPKSPKKVSQSTTVDIDEGKHYWEVNLAWTELRHNKWAAKQVSKHAMDIDPAYFVEDDPGRYTHFAYSFLVGVTHGDYESLVIRCLFHGATISINLLGFFHFQITEKTVTDVVGAFEMGGCNGETVNALYGTMPWPNPILPPGAHVEAQTFVLAPGKSGLSMMKAGRTQPLAFLHESPSRYRLLCPHQFADYLLQAPLFYQDKGRTFFITPHDEQAPHGRLAKAEHAAFHPRATSRGSAAHAAAHKAAAKGKEAHGGAKSGKSDKAHQSSAASHSSAKEPKKGIVLHSGTSEVSEELAAIDKELIDIGEAYSKHAASRKSAWGHHALKHSTHETDISVLQFETFYHPYVCDFMKAITRLGIGGLLTEDNQRLGSLPKAHPTGKTKPHTSAKGSWGDFFTDEYKPTSYVSHPYPSDIVDFGSGPYAIYNQELFHYIPVLIADRLHQNQRYTDAIRWFKYVFDPTEDSKTEAPPSRYWKYVPFQATPRDSIQQVMDVMESGDENHSQLVADWAKNPFQPFAVARHRQESFKKSVFMKYVQTLIDQGDALFRSDLKEAVNEAQQYYIMAAHLLGPKPVNMAPRTKPRPESYASLRSKVDPLSAGITLLENEFPFSGHVTGKLKGNGGGLHSLGPTLYFCAPANDQLLGLWDIVADRLYKIRNCLNIAGVYRQLALFDPPIDPGMLIRAAAAGVDLGSLLTDMSAPLPNYRFTYMLQKALDMSAECRSFGSSLLSALEKNDAEALSVMRSQHEVTVLDLMHRVKVRQLEDANAQIDTLNGSRNTAAQRYLYYQTLNGNMGASVPAPGAEIQLLPVPAKQPSNGGDGIQLLPEEQTEMTLMTAANVIQDVGVGVQALAGVLHALPQFDADGEPFGVGVTLSEGGIQLGSVADVAATVIRLGGDILSQLASHSGKMAGYFRRQADWALQSNLAACELMQIDKQIAAANIRVDIAQKELDSHEKQMENAQAILDYMTQRKFTNQDLYGWMVSDTSGSYFSCYQMAFDLARKAERTFRYERGLTSSSFIQYGYWDSLRKGLLAGDRLHLALKQLEQAYVDQNSREYEISRDISVLLNAPLALIALKETGACEVVLPESLFDADYPGHYMRRIKNVTLSIPCVVGPYTSINCTVTLLSNKVRLSSDVGDQYPENVQDGDDRFVNNFGAVQSIATSHGSNDGGLFEVSFRDERYLPFEGAGAISRWRIEMPRENNAFDFETISDVILHLKYTARDGGDPLKQAARSAIAAGPQDGLLRLFSVRHEFPTEWYGFMHPNGAATTETMNLNLGIERFPYLFRGKAITINAVETFLKLKDLHDTTVYTKDGTPLGDYAGSSPLALHVTPPGGTDVSGKLKSDKALYNALPHASMDVSDQSAGLGAWQIEARPPEIQAIAASLRRTDPTSNLAWLKADVYSDLILVLHYSVG